MKAVTLSLDDQLADQLGKMSPSDINRLMKTVQIVLADRRSLEEVIRDAQEQAKKNGLTQEKLDEILRELK